jgi:thiamine-phosphate pyrophosphorylase
VDGSVRRERLLRSRLYLVLEGRPHGDDPRPLLDAALRGGVDVVQLRDKTLDDDELVEAAAPFRAACEEYDALFILNDRPDLATRCRADGVHVGQDDASFDDARAFVGPSRLVGVSTGSSQEILAAQEAGADYLGVQTIYPTPTKPDGSASGLWLVEAAARTLTIPWFAIGGIGLSNVAEVVAAGAPGVAVVRAIRDAEDPEAAARSLRRALDRQE